MWASETCDSLKSAGRAIYLGLLYDIHTRTHIHIHTHTHTLIHIDL